MRQSGNIRRSHCLAAIIAIVSMIAGIVTFVPQAQAAASYPLGVDLGGGAQATVVENLKQNVVYKKGKAAVRQWRENAYNDSRVKFQDSSLNKWDKDYGKYFTVKQLLARKKMTKEQYLDPAWDNGLERIALQRAVEAQYTQWHKRTGNNADPYSATYGGKAAYCELLAWNWYWPYEGSYYTPEQIFDASFHFWSDEKEDYIKYTNHTRDISAFSVAHYSNLITPEATRVGMGMVRGTLAAAIGRDGSHGNGNKQPLNVSGTRAMAIAVNDDIVRANTINKVPNQMGVNGKRQTANTVSRTTWNAQASNNTNQDVVLPGRWTSSNPRVVKIEGNKLTAVGKGSATITYETGGRKYSKTVAVERFSDVNSKTPHQEHIHWLANAGITTGYNNSDGSQRYEGMTTVKRQDMAAFLRRLAKQYNIANAENYKPSAHDWKRFKDVNAKTPHAEDILWLASTGISTGWKEADGSWTFRGMDTVKRQDMAAFLKRLADKAGKSGGVTPKTDFTDVDGSTPHVAEVQWLGGSSISTGYRNADGTWRFQGMTSVYRQDMAAFLHRLDSKIK